MAGSGNSRLVGGPEDGEMVDVAWPPAPRLSRRVGDEIVHYDLKVDGKGRADLDENNLMDWVYAESEAHVEPFDIESRNDPAAAADGDDEKPARRGGSGSR